MDETSASAVEPPANDDTTEGAGVGLASVIADVFAQVFEREFVGLDEDFFKLGGDSLMAAGVMAAIEERYQIALSISALLEAPTPRTLAAAVDAANVNRVASALMEINAHSVASPIFYIHGSGGESMLPPRLSKEIGDRPFYAFRAIGLEEGERPLSSIEAMASAYLAAVVAKSPSGPLIVLGHCAGSMIAYELAQQLTAAGRPPMGLILIDPTAWDQQVHLHTSGMARELKQASVRKQIAVVEKYLDSNPVMTMKRRRDIVRALIEAAAAAYTPEPYTGRTLLFVTTTGASALLHPQRGFPALVPNLDVVRLDVRHERYVPRPAKRGPSDQRLHRRTT